MNLRALRFARGGVHRKALVESAFLAFHGLNDAIADEIALLDDQARCRVVPGGAGELDRAGKQLGKMVFGPGDIAGPLDVNLQEPIVKRRHLVIENRMTTPERRHDRKVSYPMLSDPKPNVWQLRHCRIFDGDI